MTTTLGKLCSMLPKMAHYSEPSDMQTTHQNCHKAALSFLYGSKAVFRRWQKQVLSNVFLQRMHLGSPKTQSCHDVLLICTKSIGIARQTVI